MSISNKLKGRPLTAIFSLIVMCMLGFSLGMPVDAGKPAKEKPAKSQLGSRGNGELAVCPIPVIDQAAYAAKSARVASFSAPLEDAFIMHSNPGATQILYIDFDGYVASWATLTPFNMDGDPNSFNNEERQVIIDTWFAVSEDFLPFNIDVTTEEPPNGWLGQRAVVDGSNLYTYSWAYGGAWASTSGEIAYCYHGDDSWQWIENSVSHEVGHTLNLAHDGSSITGEGYYTGHGTGDTQWCPLMGWGADSLNVWSNGDYNGATNNNNGGPQEDDVLIIDAVTGVDFRADDHGSDIGSATAITLPSTMGLVAEGIIGRRTDVDFFAFTTGGGNVQFSINEDVIIGATNLDLVANIHNSGGAVIHTSNPVDRLWATFDVTLATGDYYLSIDGVGMGDPMANPPTGYSDYSSLGYFSIYAQGTASSGDPVPDVVGLAQAAAESAITGAGFTVGTVSTSYSGSVAAGDVISQTPTAGTNAAAGSSVDIEVSLGILVDTTAPNPDPMTWASVPAPVSGSGSVVTVFDNGFETPDQGTNGWSYTPAGSSWTLNSGSGLSGEGGPWKSTNNSPDPLGTQFAFMQNVTSISQNLTGFTVGATCELTFYDSTRTSYSGNDLTVILDEGLGSEITIYSSSLVNNSTWAARTSSQWVASKTSYTLTFRTTNPQGGDRATIIDGAKVTATLPGGDSETEITMTASTASDLNGVEYNFTNTSGPGNDSGWQDSTSYTDSGLQAGTEYTYSVVARDKSSNQNVTGASVAASATTSGTPPGDPVPNVVGLAQVAAESTITGAGFVVGTVSSSNSDTVAAGNVISSNPVAGTSLPAGSSVNIEVSLGVLMVTVPDVTGLAQATAEANITAAQLAVGVVSTAYSNTVAVGDVISQNPAAGSSVAHDSDVDIEVSLGVEPVTVPDVVGSAQAAAEASITGASLVVGTVSTSYSDVVAGDVISQSPAGGASVAPGTSVDIEVSLGVEMVTVPNVVDAPQATAEASITASNLTVGTVTTAYSNTIATGNVISQNPSAGSSVVHDSAVNIEVSLGVQPVTVPNVVGSAQAAAEASITGASLAVGTVSTSYSDTVANGDVISQSPAGGASVAPGTSVDIEVSLGVQMVTVPNVTGLAQATAEANITAAVLSVGTVSTSYSNTVAAGLVISQSPSAGSSVVHDTAVNIEVSLGVQPVNVPNVVGSAQAAAEASITGAGLAVGTVSTSYSDTVANGNIISQNPAGGSSVLPGTSVNIEVSLGVQMVTVPNVVGSTQAAAEAAITGAILTVGTVTTEYSETVAAGDVISQSPSAGTSVVHDTNVDILVSLGTESAVNLVLPENGGVLESFTSQYSGTWGLADRIANGLRTDNGWASTVNPEPFQEFVFSFENGNNAFLNEAQIYGGLAEGLYFSKDVEVWTSLNGSGFTLAASGTLASGSHSTITLNLGNVEATKVKLVITSGYRTDYWELGEFEVYGVPGPPPPPTTVPSVVGLTQAAAESAIAGANLSSSVSTASSETVAAGLVISQSIASGSSVPTGTSVGIVVSTGTAPSGDDVNIIKAEFKADKSELKVEATSSDNGNVTLTVVGYGVMTYKADKNKYEYKAKPTANPGATVTVTSSGGGQATGNVTQK